MRQKISDFRYRRDKDFLTNLDELRIWNKKLETKPVIAKAEAKKIALHLQRYSLSDRFVFNRVLSSLLMGFTCPQDYSK